MKKLISIFLAVVMLTMCMGISGFAATDMSFGASTLVNIIDILDRNMPRTQARRVQVFNLLAMYIESDLNLDALIDMTETLIVPDTDPNKATFDEIIGRLGTDLTENQDTVLFVLDLLRALPYEKRAYAIEKFKEAQDAVDAQSATDGSWWATEEEADVVLESVDQEALENIYNYFVHNDVELGHEQLGTHGIGINTILRLSFAFQGSLVLTDASVGSDDFAVKTISDDFKNGLYTYVTEHFNPINGVEITDGDDVIGALVDALNEFGAELKADIKTVLGASEIALYEALADEEDDDDSNRPGSNRPNGGYLGGSSDDVDMSKEVGNIKPNMSESVGAPASAEAAYIYTDTADHWAKDYIGELSKRGIFNGYEDGSFRPDLGITREEIAVALTRALNLEDKARRAPYYSYSDSSYISTWALDAVNMMSKLGVFTGYDDGLYRPQQVITREQMVAVIMRMFDNSVPKTTLNFTDEHVIGDWAVSYVEGATTLEIVAGYPDGTFRATNYITRAEAAKILYVFMHYANLL